MRVRQRVARVHPYNWGPQLSLEWAKLGIPKLVEISVQAETGEY